MSIGNSKFVMLTDYIQLYCGDCLDLLPRISSKKDAIVTDPPYGINIIHGGGRGINGWRDYRKQGSWDSIRPSKEYFDLLLQYKYIIIWGGNYFTDYLPPTQQWLMWDKGQRNFSLADGELAWSNQNRAIRIITYPRGRMKKEGGLHPTQKPIEVMKWCIEKAKIPTGTTIIDPYMGSGTTGIACIRTGYKFIGIERDPAYFEIAKSRIEKEIANLHSEE